MRGLTPTQNNQALQMTSPALLTRPSPGDLDSPLLEIGLDLTIYAERLSVPEWEAVLDIYRKYAPADVWTKVKASPDIGFNRLPPGDYINAPLSDDATFPFLRRIRDRTIRGWRTEFRIWDGKLSQSWSACIYRLAHQVDEPEYVFYRFLFPWDTAPALVASLANELGKHIKYLSGHAGFCHLYDPYFKSTAFAQIFAWAKRYWAVDVEDLNAALPFMHNGMKAISWLTFIGAKFLADPKLEAQRQALKTIPGAVLKPCGSGALLQLGEKPILGDRHRFEPELSSYFAAGLLLDPVLLTSIAEFEGPFAERGCTVDWIHRFAAPNAWTSA